MAYPLAAMARRAGRRRNATFRDIVPPAVMATDLYRACYLPVLSIWTRGAEQILALYTQTLAQMATDSPADIEGEIDRLGAAMQSLILSLTPEVRDWALRVETWHRQKWRGAVLAASGVDLSTLIGPEGVRETLQARIAANVALIKDVGQQAQTRIAGAVFRGLTERQPAREVAKAIREAVDMGRTRARNIAADQLTKLSGELADERRREAGLDVWEWRHSGKRHPRPEHLARNGNYYSEVAARQGTSVGGKLVRVPPERGDWPSRPPFCACRSRAVLILE
jgi:uncharacterized protein with gpF-like domain